MSNSPIHCETSIPAPFERVWQALTDPAQLTQWLLPPFLGATLQLDDNNTLRSQMGGMSIPFASLKANAASQQVVMQSLPDERVRVICSVTSEHDAVDAVQVKVAIETAASDKNFIEAIAVPTQAGWIKALANLSAFVSDMLLPYPEGYVAALFGHRREYQQTYTVERSIWIAASRDKVWQAVTDPKKIQSWFSPNTTWHLTALEPGGLLSIVDPESGADTHIHVIDVLEPPARLVLRTQPPSPDSAFEVTTYVLSEENNGTRLVLTHAGYNAVDADARHQSMEQNAFGFGMMLENLRAAVLGEALPYPFGF